MTFNATMIRERCLIKETALSREGNRVLSNRMVISVGEGNVSLVVRGQHMHSVVRLTARLYNEITQRNAELDTPKGAPLCQQIWQAVLEEGRLTSRDNWTAFYLDGALIYKSGEHHPFLDMIEMQAANNANSYDMNVMIAAETMNAAGAGGTTIDHDSNVALIFSVENGQARCGLIYRHPRRTTTFSFSINESKGAAGTLTQEISNMLESSADFLECIQLCYAIATEVSKGPDQNYDKQDMLNNRLQDIRRRLNVFDDRLNVSYRPERPDIARFLEEAKILVTKKARL